MVYIGLILMGRSLRVSNIPREEVMRGWQREYIIEAESVRPVLTINQCQ